MTTPVLDEVFDCLQRLTKCETVATKHAAVKTMIELGEKTEQVVVTLVELLLDPAKVIRNEAKAGLQRLGNYFYPLNSFFV